MSFCSGARGEALKSRCRNGLDGGQGRASSETRGNKEKMGVRGRGSWKRGRSHARASYRARNKVLYFRLQSVPRSVNYLPVGPRGPASDRRNTPLRSGRGSVPKLGPGARAPNACDDTISLKYVTLMSPQTGLFNITPQRALSRTVAMEPSASERGSI